MFTLRSILLQNTSPTDSCAHSVVADNKKNGEMIQVCAFSNCTRSCLFANFENFIRRTSLPRVFFNDILFLMELFYEVDMLKDMKCLLRILRGAENLLTHIVQLSPKDS